jgi:hypothetical protein
MWNDSLTARIKCCGILIQMQGMAVRTTLRRDKACNQNKLVANQQRMAIWGLVQAHHRRWYVTISYGRQWQKKIYASRMGRKTLCSPVGSMLRCEVSNTRRTGSCRERKDERTRTYDGVEVLLNVRLLSVNGLKIVKQGHWFHRRLWHTWEWKILVVIEGFQYSVINMFAGKEHNCKFCRNPGALLAYIIQYIRKKVKETAKNSK